MSHLRQDWDLVDIFTDKKLEIKSDIFVRVVLLP